MHFLIKILTLTVTLAPLAKAAPALSDVPNPANIVDLKYVRYQGISNDTLGVTSYYSIRYAAPPTGNLRWQPPIPIEKAGIYSGNPLINASSPSFQCIQTSPAWAVDIISEIADGQVGSPLLSGLLGSLTTTSTQPQSEDCLRLDVTLPNSPRSSKLPVVVMIHGGGYVSGSSFGVDGSQFVSAAGGAVIYVAIQYRLGPYGFLSGSEIKQHGTPNSGLLDQRLALEWVQNHIEAFGGDPSKVTIWGGSAGGGSVGLQMLLNGGEPHPPFRAGIAEYPGWVPFRNDTTLEAQFGYLLTAANCSDIQCLRNTPAEKLANISQEVYMTSYAAKQYGYGDYYFTPTVDGKIIQELPSKGFSEGKFSKVPVIADREAYEGLFFTNFTINNENEILPDLEQFWPGGNASFFDNLLSLYPLSDYSGLFFLDPILTVYGVLFPQTLLNSPFYQRAAIFGDGAINCPSYFIASGVADAGLPAYKMRFAAGYESHGATSLFLLGSSDSSGNPTLANQMKDYFVSFITNLDPNAVATVSKPSWPQYQSDSYQVLDVEQLSISTEVDPDAGAQCRFFQAQADVVRV